MVASKATSLSDYLAELEPGRRRVIGAARRLINRHLPRGYQEVMAWGMLMWQIPLARYPSTHNKQALAPVALAAQKDHNALYLLCAYTDSPAERALRAAYEKAGKELELGNCCLRFRSLDELVPGAIAPVLEATTVESFIALYEASRPKRGR